MVQRCRGCGTLIEFRRTDNDKWIPVNVDSEVDGDPMLIVTGAGKAVWIRRPEALETGAIQGIDRNGARRAGRVAHFATCPRRDRFRRKQ